MKRRKVTIEGYGTVDAKAGPGGHSGRVYVPTAWIGRQVLVVLLSDLDEPLPEPKTE